MSYKVLARKYRSQTFAEVIGQNHITRTLQNAISLNKIAHAYLFTGTRGVGKTSIARIFAKAVNCENRKETEPCNTCKNCAQITTSSSANVIEIDGASNRGIDEIRNLKEGINYAPLGAKYKIYIIDEFHMLTTEAFNAFLKTLEEPPSHVIFILATTEPHKIPNTVLSRCQRYDFRKISSKNILGQLKLIAEKEKIEISDKSLLSITKEANGSMRDAESLLDQIITFTKGKVEDEDVLEILGKENRQNTFSIFKALLNKETKKVLELLNKFDFEGADIQVTLKNIIELLKTSIEIHLTNDTAFSDELSEEECSNIKDILKGKSFEELDLMYEILMRAYESMNRSDNPFLVCEIALLRATRIADLKSINELLKNLREIEKNITELNPVNSSEKSWDNFLKYVNYKNPVIFSFLRHTEVVEYEENKIVLDFGGNSFLRERVSDGKSLKELNVLAKEYFKKDVAVSFTKDNTSKQDISELASDDKIKDILNKFNGEIIDK